MTIPWCREHCLRYVVHTILKILNLKSQKMLKMQLSRNHGRIHGVPLHYWPVEKKPRFPIWPLLTLRGRSPHYYWWAWEFQLPIRCLPTSLAGTGRNASSLLPTWPSLTPRGWIMALWLQCGGTSPNSPLGLLSHHPNEKREGCLIPTIWGWKSISLLSVPWHYFGVEVKAPHYSWARAEV